MANSVIHPKEGPDKEILDDLTPIKTPVIRRQSSVKMREAALNDFERNNRLIEAGHYTDNYVSTTKYTKYSFIPKILFEFFRVVANCYFLVISLLQLCTTWSPTNEYTTSGPLMIVLMVSMLKQGLEDKRRYDADQSQNNRTCEVLEGTILTTRPWHTVKVGQILKISNNDEVAADVLILGTSEEEGRCFIETSNLDGEINLKRKGTVGTISKMIGCRLLNDPVLDEATFIKNLVSLKGIVTYEMPNDRLYHFVGNLSVNDAPLSSLSPDNVLLRGCTIRSCGYVYGFVLYTGAESKLMQNARETPSKQSNLYRIVNQCIFLVFLTQFVLCTVSCLANIIWNVDHANAIWYLPYVTTKRVDEFMVSFFTFLILYNNLVPISLYVSLDMIKVLQAKRIMADPALSHNGFDAIVRTSDLNEELGQIEYIFSDKTGTLTQNIMEFRKCSIGPVAYGYGTTEIGRAVAAAKNKSKVEASESASLLKTDYDETSPEHRAAMASAQVHLDPSVNFDDPRLLYDLEHGATHADLIHHFLILLSVCHTVIPEVEADTGKVSYRASSPDEESLVKGAKCLGYNFILPAPLATVTRTRFYSDEIDTLTYTILNVNEFNSTRKRMSVLAKSPDGKIMLYCKGADNVMFERSKTDEYASQLKENVEQFALEGLRTLVLAKKELTWDEYRTWDAAYQVACSALTDREAQMDAVAETIETDMDLLGATAIEDKLQKGVPETIASLAEAGVKLWVLTGDKEETAINIGYACRLLNDGMRLLIVNSLTKQELIDRLDYLNGLPELIQLCQNGAMSQTYALVVDGHSLTYVFDDNDRLERDLLKVATCCSVVIACRVSPAQKAALVTLVRQKASGHPITLAIGDGANDVNMIQTAHVGVGICGQEGVQAVNASDYAIAQFRFLKPLLLVHGRYNYKRISKVILYSFYKNIALVFVLFLYNFYNGQSGMTLFESFVMAGWNFFLAMPIIAIGIYDEDVSPAMVLAHPQLYHAGQVNSDLNVRSFSLWIGNAILHASICFGLPLGYMLRAYGDSGQVGGVFYQGTILYTGLLMTMNAKVMLMTNLWMRESGTAMVFSILLFFFFLFTYPNMTFVSWDMFGVASEMLSTYSFWFTFFFVPLVTILLDVSLTYLYQYDFPTPGVILREHQHCGGSSSTPLFTLNDASVEAGGGAKQYTRGMMMTTTSMRLTTPFVTLTTSPTTSSIATTLKSSQKDAVRQGKYRGSCFSSPSSEKTTAHSSNDGMMMTELVTQKVFSCRRHSHLALDDNDDTFQIEKV